MGITALGTERGLETRLVPERGYELALIPAVPLPRKPTPELITVPGRLRGTIKAAEQILERTKADAVVGFGGYVALPGYLAAKRLGVPIVVHEANARPGLANKIGSRYASAGRRLHARQQAARRPLHRHPAAPLHRHPGPGRRPPRGPRRVRARPEPADAAGLRRLAGRPPPQRGDPAGRAAGSSRPGIQILHAVGPKNELPQVHQMPGMPPVHPGTVPGPDGPRVRRGRHDALPRGRDDRRRTLRRRAPGRLRPAAHRQRRTAAQRPAGGQGRRRTAGRRRGTDARVGAAATCCRCSPTRTGCTRCPAPPPSSAAGTPTTCSSAWCTRRSPRRRGVARPHRRSGQDGGGRRSVAGPTTAERGERQQESSGPPPARRFEPRPRLRTIVVVGRRRSSSSRAAPSGLLYGSTWLRVERRVRLRHPGAHPRQVREAAAVPVGEPLVSVDTDAVEARLRRKLPRIDSVEVVRSWPHGIGLKVTERTPVLLIEKGGKFVEVDDEGVRFATVARAPKGVPLLELSRVPARVGRREPAALRRRTVWCARRCGSRGRPPGPPSPGTPRPSGSVPTTTISRGAERRAHRGVGKRRERDATRRGRSPR